MDLPSAFFPSVYQHHSSHHPRRDYFLDYGSHMNVDIEAELTQDGQVTSVSQKQHPGLVKNAQLSAVLPILPLSVQPVDVLYPFQDPVGDKVRRHREKAYYFIKKVHHNEGRLCQNATSQFHLNMMQVGDQVSKSDLQDDVDGQTSCVLPHLTAMNRDYCHLTTNTKYIRVNSSYTGGCLCCMEVSGNTHLLHLTGEHLDRLHVVEVQAAGDRRHQLRERVLYDVAQDGPGLEVRSSCMNNTGYCCVRRHTGYSLYSITEDGTMVEPTCVYKRHMSEEIPTSVCLSPFISGEVVVSTNTGQVHLSSVDNSDMTLLREQPLRFPAVESWRQCHWGSHPRQVILVDRTCVQLFDSRTEYGDGVDLFAQPSKLLHQEERVMVTESYPGIPYYHYIATDYTLMLVDQRLPLYPVMLWPHTLPAAPQYLSVVHQDTNNTLVMVASQTPAKTHCFHVQHGGHQPVRSCLQPWRLSTISDMTRYDMGQGLVDQTLLQQRMTSSLAGMSGCDISQSLQTYQLSSHGEVFYQIYMPEQTHCDKTYNLDNVWRESIPAEASQVAERWLKKLQGQFDRLTAPENLYHMLDVSAKGESAHLQLPHVLCRFCMPATSLASGVLEDEVNTFCTSCGHPLHLAHTISQHSDKVSVVETGVVHDDLFNVGVPQIDNLNQSSANTQLLSALWRQEDVHGLVQEREIQRQSLLQKKQEKRVVKHKSLTTDRYQMSVIDQILASTQPRIVEEDDDADLEERSGDERTVGSEEENLQSVLEKVCISPKQSESEHEEEAIGMEGIIDPSQITTYKQGEKFVASDSDRTSLLRLQDILVCQPGFSSVPHRLHSVVPSLPKTVLNSDLTDEEENFFSQEVRESLQLFSPSSPTLSLSTQKDNMAEKLKLFSRIRKQSQPSTPVKKQKTLPGF